MVYVRDEVVWQGYVVLQCWIGLELLESTENVQVKWGSSSTGTFSLDHLLIARSLSKSELNSAKWTQFWIKILMPDLRILLLRLLLDIESSCRSNLMIKFDTSRQLLSNLPGSTSIHFRSRYGMVTGDNVKFGVCCGLAFAISFPVLLSPTLSM